MKKWAVIDEIMNGDDFSKIYESKEEAVKSAEYLYHHFTKKEKQKRNLCVALVDVDEDGCIDFMAGYTPYVNFIEDGTNKKDE